MSLAEAAPELKQPIFGPIRIEDMQKHEALAKTVMPLVQDACKHSKGRFTVNTVAQGLVSGAYKLWGVMAPPATLESVAVTTVDVIPGGRVFDVLLVGPDFDSMFRFLPVLHSAARAQACVRMRMTGPGFWKKRLGDGWRMEACIFERDVTG